MNVLLVEDEEGLREGLAAFLRVKGHVVRTAATCAAGVAWLARERFDVVATDWRLPDGRGDTVLRACDGKALVMSGYPDDVVDPAGKAPILRKPVSPGDLLLELERLQEPARPRERPGFAQALEALPRDTADRLRLAWVLAGAAPDARLLDDGACVVLRSPLHTGDAALAALEPIGGDLRVLSGQPVPILELRLWRDGRPEGATVIRRHEPWPAEDPLAIDLDGDPCGPLDFVALVEEVARARRRGRAVEILHIPGHLRLQLELLGKAALLPMRASAGPRLPEVLVELWRQG